MTTTIGTLNAGGDFASLMKTKYSSDKVIEQVFKKRPALAMLPKDESWGGPTYNIPVYDGDPQGGLSPDFASGSNGVANSTVGAAQFALTTVYNYNQASITGEVIAAGRAGSDQFFLDGVQKTVDGVLRAVGGKIEGDLFRGYLGVIATTSSVTTTVITLSDAADALRFEVGMIIQASPDLTSARGTAGNRITAINRSAGTITFATAVNDATLGWAVGDYLCIQGSVASTSVISGFPVWLTTGTPGTLFGVTRSTDKERRSGIAITGQSSNIEEALLDAIDFANEQEGEPDVCFMNFRDFNSLKKQLGSKVTYTRTPGVKSNGAPTQTGFSGIEIVSASGPVKIIPANKCPRGTIYMLDSKTWVLASRGPIVQLVNWDGDKLSRLLTSDAYEVRAVSYSQLGCRAPGHNVRITLS